MSDELFAQLKARAPEFRDEMFAIFQSLTKQKERIGQVAGWVPSLDGPQLVDICGAVTADIESLMAYAVKMSAFFDQLAPREGDGDNAVAVTN